MPKLKLLQRVKKVDLPLTFHLTLHMQRCIAEGGSEDGRDVACLLKVSQKKCAAHFEAIGNVALKLLPHQKLFETLGAQAKSCLPQSALHNGNCNAANASVHTPTHKHTHSHTHSCFLCLCILFLSLAQRLIIKCKCEFL